MPQLQYKSHDAFAGARLQETYENARGIAGRSYACRLAAQQEVAARISELLLARSSDVNASPQVSADGLSSLLKH